MKRSLERQLYETANKACDKAYANAESEFHSLKGGRTSFFPVVEETEEGVEVGVGVNPDYHYLIFLEEGFASFPMKAAFGKTVPMFINGQLVFRKCTGINQYREGHKHYWQRNADGELVPTYEQARAWVHPGHEPSQFIATAVDEALEEDKEKITAADMEETWNVRMLWNTLIQWFSSLIGR